MTAFKHKAIVSVAALSLLAGFVGTRSFARPSDKSPESLEGQTAPEFTLGSLDGSKKVTLSSLKGNVVVLDYWATWCPPCRKSLPHLNEMSQDKDLAGKGLVVYAIDDKEAADKVKAFVTTNNYTFNVLLDQTGEFGKDYFVSGIPTTVVVGRDGKVAKAFVGFGEDETPSALKAAVEEALKAPMPAKNG